MAPFLFFSWFLNASWSSYPIFFKFIFITIPLLHFSTQFLRCFCLLLSITSLLSGVILWIFTIVHSSTSLPLEKGIWNQHQVCPFPFALWSWEVPETCSPTALPHSTAPGQGLSVLLRPSSISPSLHLFSCTQNCSHATTQHACVLTIYHTLRNQFHLGDRNNNWDKMLIIHGAIGQDGNTDCIVIINILLL